MFYCIDSEEQNTQKDGKNIMFAPMTPQNDYARFEAEIRERTRRAEHLMNAQMTPSLSVLDNLIGRFTEWALRRREPASPVVVSEPPVTRAPECC